jgi:hypothetical protein
MEVSGQNYVQAAFLPDTNVGTQSIGGWMGPKCHVSVLEKRELSSPCRDSKGGPSSL